MSNNFAVTHQLRGVYRDVLRDGRGRVMWDRGWQSNKIVVDCRRLLAGFMHGTPTGAFGIQGLQVGQGSDAWDQSGPPPVSENQVSLVDPFPATVPRDALNINYLDPGDGSVADAPTSRLQIVATIGPHVPNWPDAHHPTLTLREFGLVGTLDAATVLINYVRHQAIVKDPTSTLERTIWLAF